MIVAVVAIFLSMVAVLFLPAVQAALKAWFHRAPARIYLVPAGLTAFFAAILAGAGAWSWPFLGIAAAYTMVPAVVVASGGAGARKPRWADFAAILLLWLPLEFYTGKSLLAREAWGLVNIAAHGAAVVLGLFLFLIYRDLKGVKYNPPRRATDLLYPLIGFAAATPIFIALGRGLGFMGPWRWPEPFHAGAFGILFVKTLAGVALPEELLFRGLIQNWLMQIFGASNLTLLAAALIFGAAHLNNSPGGWPNWTYMLIATVAGVIYGKVFDKSSTILSSASLHAFVNCVRHTFFL